MSKLMLEKIPSEARPILDQHLKEKPVKLGKLAEDLGIKVKLSSLGRGISGLIMHDSGGYIIKVNRHETRERQRFTLAHEIAHFLLHRDVIEADGEIRDNVLYRSRQPERLEYEANRLAAEIILPIEHIKSDLDALAAPVSDIVIERLAQEWQVSKAAMEIRLAPYEVV
jgi:Zn-dependent peptidase ImmA (M78 family)